MGSPVNVLDGYYLAITLLVTVGYQLTGFAIAWTFQFDKITDFTGGSNFFILALLTLLLGQEFHGRNILASVFIMVWAARLAGFLLFRVLKTGSDTRFDDIRSHFFKFFGFWVGQILWVWVVSLPVTILNSPKVSAGVAPGFGTASDILGIIIWAFGWSIETAADLQKFRYKSTNPPKEKPIDVGLWAWSRHPPYFGEILCWWGIWTLSIAPALGGTHNSGARSALLGSLVSPLFTMILLLFGSGVPTAEKPVAQRFYKMAYPEDDTLTGHDHGERKPTNAAWANYQAYRGQTSILIPLPPTIYRALPLWMKRTVLFDLPMYEWTPRS
ncbi:hypothetical protein DICSQDRAFT_92324 [Dichomitus squalens LYAD-421 SS1]|uniref:DUF1295-domain-containing protein n=1 Tax=Dichomitus squalens (strain LYAD-421) TaxID=732165 RepID=R7SQW7_DICSQ|nr:uncharacterized protein DICSQDRAFT_92324 [Dichomitus squalens LYAD-421 SS1]EJF57362.1 hypothetical protein DICSQDRAFT_92324 [Dichomitus squalens LYAD-421 SS1]